MFEAAQRYPAPTTENYDLNKETDNQAMQNIVGKFIEALTELESAHDVEQIVALFSDNCEVGNIVVPERFYGISGARQFWTNYRQTFKDVCSVFQDEVYSGNEAKLEWTTEGKSKNGQKIKYAGVSILETKGGKISRFYAHFDPKKLERQIRKRKDGTDAHTGLF